MFVGSKLSDGSGSRASPERSDDELITRESFPNTDMDESDEPREGGGAGGGGGEPKEETETRKE